MRSCDHPVLIFLHWKNQLGTKKMTQMNLFTKQKQTHRHREQTYGYQKGKVREGDSRGTGRMYILMVDSCCSKAEADATS